MTGTLFAAVLVAQLASLVGGFVAGWLFRCWQVDRAAASVGAETEAWQASIRRRHAELRAARRRRFRNFPRPMGVRDA